MTEDKQGKNPLNKPGPTHIRLLSIVEFTDNLPSLVGLQFVNWLPTRVSFWLHSQSDSRKLFKLEQCNEGFNEFFLENIIIIILSRHRSSSSSSEVGHY